MSGEELERLQKENAEMLDDWLRKRPERIQWARQNHGKPPFRADAETMQRFNGDAGLLRRACGYWRIEAKARDHWWEFSMPVTHFEALSRSLTAYADDKGIFCDNAILNFAERSTRLVCFCEPPEAGGRLEAGFEMHSLHKAAILSLQRIQTVLPRQSELLTEPMTKLNLAKYFNVGRNHEMLDSIPGVVMWGAQYRVPLSQMPPKYHIEMGLIRE